MSKPTLSIPSADRPHIPELVLRKGSTPAEAMLRKISTITNEKASAATHDAEKAFAEAPSVPEAVLPNGVTIYQSDGLKSFADVVNDFPTL